MSRASLFLVIVALLCVIQLTFASNAKGLQFLEENKNKPGVITLPSGMQYKVLKEGSGAAHPTADTPCDCHYEGTLIDGTVFDSSYKRGDPTSFAPNQVIKGWTEAMQLMVEGDKWEMYIPSEMAYGSRGSPPKIGPDEVLIFQMEIIKIKGKTVPAAKCDPATLQGCNEQEGLFVAKVKDQGLEKWNAELERLSKMTAHQMKPELAVWLTRRVAILKKLVQPAKLDL